MAKKAGISLEISLVPDVSAMEYILKNSGYLAIASQAIPLFFQFPNRFTVPMAGPEYVVPYYLIYLEGSRGKIDPLRKWIYQETGKL